MNISSVEVSGPIAIIGCPACQHMYFHTSHIISAFQKTKCRDGQSQYEIFFLYFWRGTIIFTPWIQLR